MTASTPAPSALRSTAPMLPGFSTASMTTISGSAGRAQVSRAPRDGARTTATSPSARSPNATLAKAASVVVVTRHAARLERVERRPRVLAGQQRLAHERLDDLDARFERPAQLARPVDERQAGRVAFPSIAQRRGRLDARVRRAGQGRCRHRGHLAPSQRAYAPSPRLAPDVGVQPQVAGLDERRRTAASRGRAAPPAGRRRGARCGRSAARTRRGRGAPGSRRAADRRSVSSRQARPDAPCP